MSAIRGKMPKYQIRFVGYLDEQGQLRRELERSQAADKLWTLTSYDLYRRLVAECDWSPQRYEFWLMTALVQRLVESTCMD